MNNTSPNHLDRLLPLLVDLTHDRNEAFFLKSGDPRTTVTTRQSTQIEALRLGLPSQASSVVTPRQGGKSTQVAWDV